MKPDNEFRQYHFVDTGGGRARYLLTYRRARLSNGDDSRELSLTRHENSGITAERRLGCYTGVTPTARNAAHLYRALRKEMEATDVTA